MDPLSALDILSNGMFLIEAGIVDVGAMFGRALRGPRPGPLDSAEWDERVRLDKHKTFHGVWDIPLTGDGDWSSPIRKSIWEPEENLPVPSPQDADKIRLTIREVSKDEQVLDSEHFSGFTLLSSQWRRHVELECHTFVVPKDAEHFDNPPPADQFSTTTGLYQELSNLDLNYRLIRSSENWKQAFLLQFHQVCLNFFVYLLAHIVLGDKREIYDNIDPARAQLRQWNLQEITKHSYTYKDLREMGQELITATESLVDVVRASLPVSGQPERLAQFAVIEAELRGICREIKERLQQISDGLDHDLKYLQLARDANQTRSVQRLTLLATIFLPLSLAAGVLSMQTRFVDLGFLLYDFFGVAVLLGAIVVIIFIIMTVIATIKEAESRLKRDYYYRNYYLASFHMAA
ncbi:hypothetical protein N0V84_002848 [Fusarium piperis]|uniref:Uncharacterized protein n=1 Tax=Fusarium piperis TaxID=1435070 RepID=A0A9W9BRY1_9HYPO|nr:hypothetical protein N0V84_002848 [Fusarium piperis]